jgi:hypothetical protein
MSLRLKFFQSAWLVVSAAPLFGQSQLAEHRLFIPERGEVIAYLVSTGTNHFSFLPPPKWRVSCKPGATSVVMIAEDLRTSITIDFIKKLEGEAAPGTNATTPLIFDRHSPTNSPSYPRARQLVSSRYPEGPVRESFVTLTGVGEGLTFDVERRAGSGPKLVSRIVYAMQPWGLVEFALTAPPAKFAEATSTFGTVITSFHSPAR